MALMSAVVTALYGINLSQLDLSRQYVQDSREADVGFAASAAREFYLANGRYPVDTDELLASDEGLILRHTGKAILPFQYTLVENIDDGFFRFDRLGIFAERVDDPTIPANYLLAAENECGTTDFSDAGSFCFDPSVSASILEDRIYPSRRLARTRAFLTRTLGDFIVGFNFIGRTPRYRSDLSEMASGETDTLANIVGFVGTAATCANQSFSFEFVLLGCDDLFAVNTGTPVSYLYIDATNFVLISDTGNTDSAGAAIQTGVEFLLNL